MRDQIASDAMDAIDILIICLEDVRLGLDYYDDGHSLQEAQSGEIADLLALASAGGRAWDRYVQSVRPIKDLEAKKSYENHLAKVQKRARDKELQRVVPVDEEKRDDLEAVGGQAGNYESTITGVKSE